VTHRSERRFLAVALTICALLALVGRARAGEPRPMTGAGSPEELVGKLNAAIEGRNPQDYLDLLDEDFRFVPYAGAVASYPHVQWKKWDQKQEFEFVRWLSSPARKSELRLNSEILDKGLESGGEVQWEVNYLLTVDGAAFHGRATLTFYEHRKLWYLAEWEDTRPEPWEGRVVPTSGEARASFTR
jgi:hypothetical protein